LRAEQQIVLASETDGSFLDLGRDPAKSFRKAE
jgi:hypothetical protein